jgi:pimeloyl-ACP methyl ester carboxylesterase
LGPSSVPKKFEDFQKKMALRPSQPARVGRGIGADDSRRFQVAQSTSELKVSVVIVAGEQDRLVDTDAQSGRLHSEVLQSTIHRFPGHGHMIQQTAIDLVMSAITEANDSTKLVAAE